jgi:hypothetical protein
LAHFCRTKEKNHDYANCSLVVTGAKPLATRARRWTVRFQRREIKATLLDDRPTVAAAGRVASYKKADLVNCLIRHFESACAAATPTPAQQKARQWLPDALLFPAVDPDAASEPEDVAADAPWEAAA